MEVVMTTTDGDNGYPSNDGLDEGVFFSDVAMYSGGGIIAESGETRLCCEVETDDATGTVVFSSVHVC
jgi:hypothetical protein